MTSFQPQNWQSHFRQSHSHQPNSQCQRHLVKTSSLWQLKTQSMNSKKSPNLQNPPQTKARLSTTSSPISKSFPATAHLDNSNQECNNQCTISKGANILQQETSCKAWTNTWSSTNKPDPNSANQPSFYNRCARATALLAHREAACKQAIHCRMAVTHIKTGKQMECRDLIKHHKLQGPGGRVEGTKIMIFIHKHQVPPGGRSPLQELFAQHTWKRINQTEPESLSVATSQQTIQALSPPNLLMLRQSYFIRFTSFPLTKANMCALMQTAYVLAPLLMGSNVWRCWMPSFTSYTRPVPPQTTPHLLHPSCRQFWHLLWTNEGCRPPSNQGWLVWVQMHRDCSDRTLKTSMKNYVKWALSQFQHPSPIKPQPTIQRSKWQALTTWHPWQRN